MLGCIIPKNENKNGNRKKITFIIADLVLDFVLLSSMQPCSPKQIAFHEFLNMENNQPNDRHLSVLDHNWLFAVDLHQFK